MYTVCVFWLRFRMGHISDAWSCSGKFCLSHCNNWLHTNQKLSKVVAKIILKTMPVLVIIMHQSIPPAPSPPPPPPPWQLQGICPPCQSRGWGICRCCTARGPGICQPPGQSRAFDMHAVSYQNITTKKVLLEEKQIGSFVKDRNKL